MVQFDPRRQQHMALTLSGFGYDTSAVQAYCEQLSWPTAERAAPQVADNTVHLVELASKDHRARSTHAFNSSPAGTRHSSRRRGLDVQSAEDEQTVNRVVEVAQAGIPGRNSKIQPSRWSPA